MSTKKRKSNNSAAAEKEEKKSKPTPPSASMRLMQYAMHQLPSSSSSTTAAVSAYDVPSYSFSGNIFTLLKQTSIKLIQAEQRRRQKARLSSSSSSTSSSSSSSSTSTSSTSSSLDDASDDTLIQIESQLNENQQRASYTLRKAELHAFEMLEAACEGESESSSSTLVVLRLPLPYEWIDALHAFSTAATKEKPTIQECMWTIGVAKYCCADQLLQRACYALMERWIQDEPHPTLQAMYGWLQKAFPTAWSSKSSYSTTSMTHMGWTEMGQFLHWCSDLLHQYDLGLSLIPRFIHEAELHLLPAAAASASLSNDHDHVRVGSEMNLLHYHSYTSTNERNVLWSCSQCGHAPFVVTSMFFY